MRTILIIAGILLALTCHAQVIRYRNVHTDYLHNGVRYAQSIKNKSGNIVLTAERITIDGQVYVIINHESPEPADEGYTLQVIWVVHKYNKSPYEVYPCILLIDSNKKVSDFIIKKDRNTRICYSIL